MSDETQAIPFVDLLKQPQFTGVVPPARVLDVTARDVAVSLWRRPGSAGGGRIDGTGWVLLNSGPSEGEPATTDFFVCQQTLVEDLLAEPAKKSPVASSDFAVAARLLIDATRVEVWTREVVADDNRMDRVLLREGRTKEGREVLQGLRAGADRLGERLDGYPPDVEEIRAALIALGPHLMSALRELDIRPDRLRNNLAASASFAQVHGTGEKPLFEFSAPTPALPQGAPRASRPGVAHRV